MEGQKSKKEIKVELLGYLGTLKEKLIFCQKAASSKNFETIFNSLYKDPAFKDASEVTEGEIMAVMVDKMDCPKEIIQTVLKLKPFEGQALAFKSPHLPAKKLSKVLIKTIWAIKNLRKSQEGSMTQIQLDTLISLAQNPNLSRTDRLSLEKFCDLLSEKHWDDSLLRVCVQYTKRSSWLCDKFSKFVQQGANNMAVLMAMCQNPLAKDHMIDYTAKVVSHPDNVRILVTHPNISPKALEILKDRFPNMEGYISQIISGLLDED